MSPRAAYHPDFPTVLTALEIDNAVVANSLIDMRGIETILLIKVRPDACCILCYLRIFETEVGYMNSWSPPINIMELTMFHLRTLTS